MNNLKKILKREKIEYPKNDYWAKVNKTKKQQLYTGRPVLELRKYDYEKIYQAYLKNNESYAKTASELNMSRSQVRDIVIAHKNYLQKDTK